MTIGQVVILIVVAAALGRVLAGRQYALLAVSTALVFWLQPLAPVATLGFWLPFATIGLTVLAWAVTGGGSQRKLTSTLPAAATIAGVVVVVGIARWADLPLGFKFTAPGPLWIFCSLTLLGGIVLILHRRRAGSRPLLAVLLVAIVAGFVFIKSPLLMNGLSWGLELLQRARGIEPIDAPLTWLGFSYVAFRLLHTIRDRQAGRLPSVGLGEYVNYVIFFPTFTAGPIDRVERFVEDLQKPVGLKEQDWLDIIIRITLGLFKKFVVADLLAVISVSDLLVEYVRASGWMWLFLYAYAFRIYFDFSGYTDVAIGLGRLLGFKLPENFAAPYLKQNIALFWNSWHMSLTQWFRAYVFNPLTRQLRSERVMPPAWVAILITQVTTMVLIGLWHGVTWGFAAWGLWHGIGLFVHNRWAQASRSFWAKHAGDRVAHRLGAIAGTVLTFHFVAVGWLFFALSTPEIAWKAIRLLLGAV